MSVTRILMLFLCVVPFSFLACTPTGGSGGGAVDPTPDDGDLMPDPAVWSVQSDDQPVTIAEETVTSAGGTINTDSGFSIEVPEGALTDDAVFTVKTESIVTHDFPEEATVLTPMVEIENGLEFTEDFMTVTIPMELGEDDFPVVITWDPDTGRAEVLPLVEFDTTYAKVVTRHFSVFVGIKFPIEYLQSLEYMSNFKAGYDDWQFGNFASWAHLNGVCMGMTGSSLWYFENRKEENLRGLQSQYQYGQYGYNKEETPNFTEDDDVGRRLVSMVQIDSRDEEWNFYYSINPPNINGRRLTQAEIMILEVASAFVFEQAPQFLGVDNKQGTAPHAITCTGIKENTLYCVDPNHAGKTKELKLDDTTKDWISYDGSVEVVQHVCKTSTATWEKMPTFWNEMENGTIGDDTFPPVLYMISQHDEDSGEIIVSSEADFVSVNEVDTPKVTFFAYPNDEVEYTVFRLGEDSVYEIYSNYHDSGISNANEMTQETLTANELATYGLLVRIPQSGKDKDYFGYIDFKWFTVEYIPDEEPTPTPRELVIPDPCLEYELSVAVASIGEELTSEGLAQIGALSLFSKGISDLTGIEHCVNLTWLDMAYNNVTDLAPLQNLVGLETLRVDSNLVTDLTPVWNLTNLTFLQIRNMQGDILTDLTGIGALTNLEVLYANGNGIVSIEPLAEVTSLTKVTLNSNAITDLSPLASLPNLEDANLSSTYVSNLGPMLDSPVLNGLELNVFCTNVDPNCDPETGDTTQCEYLSQLEAAGADITMPDPDRECTPGPDGDDFTVPECER